MSVKIKQALTNCLTQIKNKTFDEDTIRTLLIVSREYIKDAGLLKELAHFIAHPIRDKGICHKKVNNRYAKWKLVDEQFQNNIDILKNIKTEKELSDFMLGAIQVEEIDSKLFEIIYFDGINDISEKHLIEYTGFKRKEAIEYLKSFYVKKDNLYVLKTNEIEESIAKTERMIKHFGLDILDGEKKQEVLKVVKKNEETKSLILSVKAQMDNLQKVIRGTIEFSSIFSSNGLNKEIKSALSKLIDNFNLDKSFITSIEENKDDIQLCIMTLLHDSTFTFYDGNNARTYICFYLDAPNDLEETKINYSSLESMQKKGVIALYITYQVFGKTNSYPLFVSDLKINKYFDLNESDIIDPDYMIMEVPWSTAIRIDKQLKLVLTN